MLSSCLSKPEIQVTPTSANELDAFTSTASFDWSLTRKVTVSVIGLPTVVPVQKILIIKDENGAVIYQGMHLMSESTQLTVSIPTVQQKLSAEFGSIKSELSIKNNQTQFNLCPTCE